MLPLWDPERIIRRMPFNLALVGGRRQGKSSACSHLVAMMKTKFDLVIAFIGSAAANPVIHQLMVQNWDPRCFFFEVGHEAYRLPAQPAGGRGTQQAQHPDFGGRRHSKRARGRPTGPLKHARAPLRHFPHDVRRLLHHAAKEGASQPRCAHGVLPTHAGRPQTVVVGVRVAQQHGGARAQEHG